MHPVRYHAWAIQVDVEATARAYAQLSTGEAEKCGCRDCLNWISHRLSAFPAEFIQFIRQLGIDPLKETEIAEYEGGGVEPSRNLYSGEFLFHGELLSGPDCFRPHADGKGCSLELEPLDGIRVGLSSNVVWAMTGPASAHFQPSSSCAIVAFQLYVPRSPEHYGESGVAA